MRILCCHNFYQRPGGEDLSFEAEARLLESRGHEVHRHTVHNDDIKDRTALGTAVSTLWSRHSHRDVRALIRKFRPDIVHCTNTFPLLSPSIYYAAASEGVPVVQALRNYRLLCVNGYLMRQDRVCEECIGSLPWRGVLHKCYRESRAASAVVAAMVGLHRALGTWRRNVSRYYALTEFSRRKFIEGGLPAARIAVKPNFLDPDPGEGGGEGGSVVFVGRLSREKGIETLLHSWDLVRTDIELRIIGDGPLRPLVENAAASNPVIRFRGRLNHEEVLEEIGSARALVLPSLWFEGFPRAIVESFAKGTPVIASGIGSMAEIVEDGRTGLLVLPGHAHQLADAVERLTRGDEWRPMRTAARAEFTAKYTADVNYEILMSIYREAIDAVRAPATHRIDDAGSHSDYLIPTVGGAPKWKRKTSP